ncbi:hypothetical protein BN1007_70437 [Klebsiella variicola]|nr:hypothetical protein BN1007_70437 [Klebsiella variicola]
MCIKLKTMKNSTLCQISYFDKVFKDINCFYVSTVLTVLINYFIVENRILSSYCFLHCHMLFRVSKLRCFFLINYKYCYYSRIEQITLLIKM